MESKQTTAVATRDRVYTLLEQQKPKLKSLLPDGMAIDRFIVQAAASIKATPKLLECSTESLLLALKDSCELGLPPNNPLGGGFLIPYMGQAKFVIGYKGFVQLAYRCAEILISASVVYKEDRFEYHEGSEPIIIHVPDLETERKDENIIFVYAIATFKDGRKQTCVMSRKEVDAIKNRSQSAKSDRSPWHTDFAEMARKCPIRRIAKSLPIQDDRWARLIEQDDKDYESNSHTVRMSRPMILGSRPVSEDSSKDQTAASVEEPREPGSDG